MDKALVLRWRQNHASIHTPHPFSWHAVTQMSIHSHASRPYGIVNVWTGRFLFRTACTISYRYAYQDRGRRLPTHGAYLSVWYCKGNMTTNLFLFLLVCIFKLYRTDFAWICSLLTSFFWSWPRNGWSGVHWTLDISQWFYEGNR